MKNLRFFIQNNIIMHWNNLSKCILILILASGEHILWIIWKSYVLTTPQLWQWVNLQTLQFQLLVNIISLIVLLSLIIACMRLDPKKWLGSHFPYLILGFFNLTFLNDGYLIGLFSPVTFVGYVCITAISMLLFHRKFVYPILILSLLTFLCLSWLTMHATLPYATLFSTDLMLQYPLYNSFWVSSMGFFIVPTLIGCLLLSEVLLIQWRYRKSLIEKLSQIDPLTNLYNRRSFNDRAQQIHYAKKNYVIMLLDLDYFKSINDQYGHRIGDEALKQVAGILSQNVRAQHDIVARFGGEEFIVLLQNIQLQQATRIAEHCRQAIKAAELMIPTFNMIQLTASFGVAGSELTCEVEQIIHHADLALYHAKRQGRDQVQLYHKNMDTYLFH